MWGPHWTVSTYTGLETRFSKLPALRLDVNNALGCLIPAQGRSWQKALLTGSQFSILITNTPDSATSPFRLPQKNGVGWLAGDCKVITVCLRQIVALPFCPSYFFFFEEWGKRSGNRARFTSSHVIFRPEKRLCQLPSALKQMFGLGWDQCGKVVQWENRGRNAG